jgi:hypothetical protein
VRYGVSFLGVLARYTLHRTGLWRSRLFLLPEVHGL